MTVVIYTTNSCSYCDAAKALFERRQLAYSEIDCTTDPEKRQLLVEKTGRRTVPQIFINDVPIGGFTDLRALEQSGMLDKIVAGEAAPPSIAGG